MFVAVAVREPSICIVLIIGTFLILEHMIPTAVFTTNYNMLPFRVGL